MPLVGDLRDFALHDFISLVARGAKTGSLRLRRTDDVATLYFERGLLVSVARPTRYERLGELLVRLGQITPEQLQAALDLQRTVPQRLLGQTLVDLGAISTADLQSSLRAVIEATVYDLLTWRAGEFEWRTGLHQASDDIRTPVPLEVEHMVMEGVRRVDEMARIRERIPSSDLVVRRATRTALSPSDQRSLTDDELRVLAQVDDRRTIDAIAHRLGLDTFEVSSAIFNLDVYGLVDVGSPSASTEPADQTI